MDSAVVVLSVFHDASGVSDGGAGEHCAECADLCDSVASVFLQAVADYFLASVVGELHVDVWHLAAFGVEKSLKDESVFERVEVDDVEAVES